MTDSAWSKDHHVKITIGLAISILAAVVWCTVQLHEIKYALRDRWTGQDMQVWSLQLAQRNPNLTVPDPTKIIETRVKNSHQ